MAAAMEGWIEGVEGVRRGSRERHGLLEGAASWRLAGEVARERL
jgi:hypothetical protein